MTITASLVLFAVFWFLILFIILPLNIKTQQEEVKRSYGTPTSAPINANIKKKKNQEKDKK
jgi:predicted secreted protein